MILTAIDPWSQPGTSFSAKQKRSLGYKEGIMQEKLLAVRQRIKEQNPLVLNITNHVTMDVIANGLLSLGASPIMSCAMEEMNELVQMSAAVVINLGTLNPDFCALAQVACEAAVRYQKPIILDPVGAGATSYRTEQSRFFLSNYPIAIVRGNAGEVMALSGHQGMTKGVDSAIQSQDAIEIAKQISKSYDTVIAMSGPIDVIVQAEQTHLIEAGSSWMPLITGCGCLLSAVTAAFHAVHPDPFEAAYFASYFYALCGEKAAQRAQGPGSFKMHFMDALHEKIFSIALQDVLSTEDL